MQADRPNPATLNCFTDVHDLKFTYSIRMNLTLHVLSFFRSGKNFAGKTKKRDSGDYSFVCYGYNRRERGGSTRSDFGTSRKV